MSITWGAEIWLCKPAPAMAWAVKAAYCLLLTSPPPRSLIPPLDDGENCALHCLLCPRQTPDAALESLLSNERTLS